MSFKRVLHKAAREKMETVAHYAKWQKKKNGSSLSTGLWLKSILHLETCKSVFNENMWYVMRNYKGGVAKNISMIY